VAGLITEGRTGELVTYTNLAEDAARDDSSVPARAVEFQQKREGAAYSLVHGVSTISMMTLLLYRKPALHHGIGPSNALRLLVVGPECPATPVAESILLIVMEGERYRVG
jgi:hypothetical protein